jgi:chorismate synthase
MRMLTAGESHGPQLTAIIEGLPSNLFVRAEDLNKELHRRQQGHGRGGRMRIERDSVRIVGGIRHGRTTGAPVALVIENRDWAHWTRIMGAEPLNEEAAVTGQSDGMDASMNTAEAADAGDDAKPAVNNRAVTRPRPGHADLNGGLKYNLRDLRDVLERSSARETAIRVACGAAARCLLGRFGIRLASQVARIGAVEAKRLPLELRQLAAAAEHSPVRVPDAASAEAIIRHIDEAKKAGDTLGGVIEVIAEGLPAGLGSHVQWDRKLDARIAFAVMSVQAMKGCEFGLGFEAASTRGSLVHDPILYSEERGFHRESNRSGGFEGGMTTGEPVVIRAVMKPIPTLYKPLASVDIDSKLPYLADRAV